MEPDTSAASRREDHGEGSGGDRLYAEASLGSWSGVQGEEPAVHHKPMAGETGEPSKGVRGKHSRPHLTAVGRGKPRSPDSSAVHMASVAKQIADTLAEIRSVRQLLDEEMKRSREDHDHQIGLTKDVESLKLRAIESEKRLEKKLVEFEDCLKETKKKKWEVVLTIISAFITAIAAVIVYKAFSAAGIASPPPDPKPHSSLSAPAEPRVVHFLRGEDRGTQHLPC